MSAQLTRHVVSTFAEVRDGLAGIVRWQKFVNVLPVRRENCLEHSFDAVLLAVLVAEHVRAAAPDRKFDAYALVACAAIHDIGEIHTGDVAYADRRPHHARDEALAFRSEFCWLDAKIAKSLERIYALQGVDAADALGMDLQRDATTLLFEFNERYGYLLYALEQYEAEPGNVPLVRHVVTNQLARIEELTVLLPELRVFVSEEFAGELRRV